VASGESAYSDPIELSRYEYFGLWFTFTPASAASSASANLWYEQSYDTSESTFFSSGVIFTSSCSISGIPSGTGITPKPMKFIKFGISIGSNAEPITADAILFVQ
jgi:hypothetical protein